MSTINTKPQLLVGDCINVIFQMQGSRIAIVLAMQENRAICKTLNKHDRFDFILTADQNYILVKRSINPKAKIA